jgi:hypothetical protein
MRWLQRPVASDAIEVLEVVPWATFTVTSIGVGFYAWRGDLTGVRYTAVLAGLSLVAAGAVGLWHHQVETNERQAASQSQRERRHGLKPGRPTVVVQLPQPDHH